jgi:alkylated DNA repair protein (DNA oxidative demethylase)
MNDLFSGLDIRGVLPEKLGPGAMLLRGKALPSQDSLLAEIEIIANKAPFRNMMTPGGYVMSVAMTNCGTIEWTLRAVGLGRLYQIAFSCWHSRLQKRLAILTLCPTPA